LVRLRALEPADLERAYTWVNDREVTQYLMLRYPMSRAQEEKYLTETSGQGNSFGDVRLAIEACTSACAVCTVRGQRTAARSWVS